MGLCPKPCKPLKRLDPNFLNGGVWVSCGFAGDLLSFVQLINSVLLKFVSPNKFSFTLCARIKALVCTANGAPKPNKVPGIKVLVELFQKLVGVKGTTSLVGFT